MYFTSLLLLALCSITNPARLGFPPKKVLVPSTLLSQVSMHLLMDLQGRCIACQQESD